MHVAVMGCVVNGPGESKHANIGISLPGSGENPVAPVYVDGKIITASRDGTFHVVKAGPKYELLATNQMGEVLMATPAISDGIIFVRGQHSVFAIAERGK